jgi:phosphohistidine swiveling domain-containing protein
VMDHLAGNDEAQATLRVAVDSARRFAGWRELGKSNCIKVINEARLALRELGRRLVTDGQLEHEGQVFMALDEELDLLVLEPKLVSATLREREMQWREYAELELPLFLDAREPRVPVGDLPRKRFVAQSAAVVGEVINGVPAASGRASGRARVILDPADLSSFEPGDVLVAPQTDPSWTPLFIVASAVIVGVGAQNSHAMIVSRELGIPCVAGVSGAVDRVPEGAIVTVDGSAGTVTIDEIG